MHHVVYFHDRSSLRTRSQQTEKKKINFWSQSGFEESREEDRQNNTYANCFDDSLHSYGIPSRSFGHLERIVPERHPPICLPLARGNPGLAFFTQLQRLFRTLSSHEFCLQTHLEILLR